MLQLLRDKIKPEALYRKGASRRGKVLVRLTMQDMCLSGAQEFVRYLKYEAHIGRRATSLLPQLVATKFSDNLMWFKLRNPPVYPPETGSKFDLVHSMERIVSELFADGDWKSRQQLLNAVRNGVNPEILAKLSLRQSKYLKRKTNRYVDCPERLKTSGASIVVSQLVFAVKNFPRTRKKSRLAAILEWKEENGILWFRKKSGHALQQRPVDGDVSPEAGEGHSSHQERNLSNGTRQAWVSEGDRPKHSSV